MTGQDEDRESPGGRLHGDDAGWRNLLRNLAADVAVTDAEAYARGERRMTVHHGLDDEHEIKALIDVVDDAIRSVPGAVGTAFTAAGRYTRWHFTPPAAAEQLAAVREAIERVNPGWRIDADEH